MKTVANADMNPKTDLSRTPRALAMLLAISNFDGDWRQVEGVTEVDRIFLEDMLGKAGKYRKGMQVSRRQFARLRDLHGLIVRGKTVGKVETKAEKMAEKVEGAVAR